MLGQIINDLLHRHIDVILNDALIDVSHNGLNDAELLEEFSTRIQNFLREDIFLSIYPEVGETFLSRIKDLGKIAQSTLFVKYFVSFAELFSVVARSTRSFEYLTKVFYLIKETLACPLTVLTIQIILLIWPLLQVITHHYSVLKEKEIARAAVLLDLCQRTWGRCARTNGDQFWEIELILIRTKAILVALAAMEQTLLSIFKYH